jgi:cyclopropane-fatty-acyl-phospholipid synthase
MAAGEQSSGVAQRLYDLLVHLFGVEPPLRLAGWDGTVAGASEGPTLHVRTRRAVRRLLWNPGELGLARAYVAAEIEVDGDLTDCLRALAEYGALVGGKPALTAADRREVLRTAVLLGAVGPAPKPPPEERLLSEGQRLGSRGVRGARELAASAVPDDGGLALMTSVLGRSLAYSCAYWADGTAPSGPDQAGEHHGGGDALEAAQCAKLDRICDRLGLEPGMRLLDLGCGWGALVVHAVKQRGVEAVGLVRSADRAEVVRRRLDDLGLSDRAEVRLGDVTAVDDGPYDAIAAIESLEHVAEVDLVEHMARQQNLLRPRGRLLLQTLSRRPGPEQPGQTFMTAYVMPDGPLPPIGVVVSAVEDAGMEVRLLESWREHYPRTLQAWLRRVDERLAAAIAVVGETRLRVWRLSLALSTVGFERDRIGVHQLLAVRPHADGRSGMLA